jgi:methylmalonyl-CoA mutase cobalamin-binding subunit
MTARSPPAAYPIAVVSRLTGIAADTLRAWERRYGFPRPRRDDSGIRVYSEADVARLRQITRALAGGFRPRDVVASPPERLDELLARGTPPPARAGRDVTPPAGAAALEAMLDRLRRDDPSGLEADLRAAAAAVGARRFVTEVAHPLLLRAGELWARGALEVRHEHLLTDAISARVRAMLGAVGDGRAARPLALLTTLEGELHTVGMELVALYLAAAGATPRLLGASTPAEQIVRAARALDVDVVGISITKAFDAAEAERRLRWMIPELPRRTELWAGGRGGAALRLRAPGLRLVGSWDALDAALGAQRASSGRRGA